MRAIAPPIKPRAAQSIPSASLRPPQLRRPDATGCDRGLSRNLATWPSIGHGTEAPSVRIVTHNTLQRECECEVKRRRLQRVPATLPHASLRPCPRCATSTLLVRERPTRSGEAQVPSIVHEALRQSGRQLETETRLTMESRFGHSFSDVAVHTDDTAARSADSVGARAYTVGHHIVFARGAYAPQSSRGRLLLAHELTHVLQQRGASSGGALRIGTDGDQLEHQADQIANAVVASNAPTPMIGVASTIGTAPHLAVARQHAPGGPYHPPTGTEIGCSVDDDCSTLSTKINYLRHTIESHQTWDRLNPDPRYPLGRHYLEIQDLMRALANCTRLANMKCTNQPQWIPAEQPQESPEERRARVERQLYEALPWAVAAVVVGLVIACVVLEPCGAAVLAALVAVLGAEELAIVLGILGANGVRMAT